MLHMFCMVISSYCQCVNYLVVDS